MRKIWGSIIESGDYSMWPFNVLTNEAQIALFAGILGILSAAIGSFITYYFTRKEYDRRKKIEDQTKKIEEERKRKEAEEAKRIEDEKNKFRERIITKATWQDVREEIEQSPRVTCEPPKSLRIERNITAERRINRTISHIFIFVVIYVIIFFVITILILSLLMKISTL